MKTTVSVRFLIIGPQKTKVITPNVPQTQSKRDSLM